MATNHNININLRNGSADSNLKTSAKRNIKNIRNKNASKLEIPKVLQKYNQRMGGLGSFTGLKRMGLAMGYVYAGVATANKIADVVMDVYTASSGETLMVGNIKKARSILLNPLQYAVEYSYNQNTLRAMTLARQNQANEYYRELTGKAIVGNQYGIKR